MARWGVGVFDFSARRLLLSPPEVFHLHWPEMSVNVPGLLRAIVRGGGLLLLIAAARLRGSRIVWTIHNLHSHERRHARLEGWFWRAFVPLVDGFIALSSGGREAARQAYPKLRRRPSFVIPMGHYRGICPDTIDRQTARDDLGIARDAEVLGFLGQIRPYKNVPHLVRTFRRLHDPGMRLLVAGRPDGQAARQDVLDAAEGDERVLTMLEHVPDDRVQVYLRACDLVVLPFADVLNSSSALLALAFDRPVLVPLMGAMGELQAVAGDEWVRTYRGVLTEGELRDALTWAQSISRTPCGTLDHLEWSGVAQRTLEAYRSLAAQGCR
jgi:glycosyltransferase involved in cell wall biosynthesis